MLARPFCGFCSPSQLLPSPAPFPTSTFPLPPAPFPPHISDFHRLDAVRRLKTKHFAVEIQFCLEAPDDRVGSAEPVLLSFEREVGHRQPLTLHGVGHHLRLIGWNNLVFEPLEKNERARQPVYGVNGRPLP